MAKKQVAQKLIVVESVGTIGELGGISGPVLSPCYVPIETINVMLNHHRKVYEVNPRNYQEKIPLTLRNLRKENFEKEITPVKANLAPNIYTEATVRNSNDMSGKDFKDSSMSTPKVYTTKKTPKAVEKPVEAPAAEEKKETPTSDFTQNS